MTYHLIKKSFENNHNSQIMFLIIYLFLSVDDVILIN